jgi:hypothetical protein
MINGKEYWPDNTEVAGQQFGYDFDDIGNRKTTAGGGSGATSTYSANLLNQYTQRTVPGAVDILGTAEADATGTSRGHISRGCCPKEPD